MTQYYGDSVNGSDANSGLTALLPKQSLLAIQVAASDGDSVSLANGNYLSTDGASGATSFVFTKALTIAGQSAFGAVLRSTISGASSATVRVNYSGATGITFQDVVIDARNIQERAFTRTDAVTDPPVTFTRVWFKDWYQYGIVDTSTTTSAYVLTNCTATTDYISTSTGTCYFLYNSVSTIPSVTVSGGTFTMSDPRGSNFNIYCFYIVGAATRVSSLVSITGATISVTANSSASSNCYAVWVAKCNSVTVSGNTITANAPGSSGSFQGVIITGASGLDANGSVVSGNTIYGYGVAGTCIAIGQGTSSDPSWGFTENCVVSGNTCIGNGSGSNTPHGIVCDGQANVDVHGNYVRQFAPCYLLQRCSGGKFYSNIAVGPYGSSISALYVKGSTGGGFYNNTVYLKSGGAGRAIRVRVGDDATNSSGVVFRNNLIYADTAITDYLVLVDASQAATFDHNLYYSTVALPSACFSYQGTTYDTVAAWAAARETTAIAGDPKLANPSNDNFLLGFGSAAASAGAPVFGVKDYTGRRYNPSQPSVGAYARRYAATRTTRV